MKQSNLGFFEGLAGSTVSRGVLLVLIATILATTRSAGQMANQITTISPVSAAQGTSGLTVTFTLDTDAPPPPPAGVLPTSVTLGSLTGSSVTHASQTTVTAVFNISGSEAVGYKDASVVFPGPGGTLTFSKSAAFQVTAGSGLTAGFTGAPTRGVLPLTVTFTNTSTGTITNRLWTFGDGTTDTTPQPSHTYTNTGSFTVSLTVYGAGGSNVLTRAGYLTVTAAPTPGCHVVVDTGQIHCYNTSGTITAPSPGQTFYGQDAQVFGNQPSYTLSGDGKTVYDNNTGLTWMRGPNTTLTPPVKTDKKTFSQAQAWVATVNAAYYGGFNDWRLPGIKELYSLMDFRGTDPSSFTGSDTSVLTPFIDTTYFLFGYGQTNASERIIDSQYASSDVFVVNPAETGSPKLFGLNLADGRIKGYDLLMPDGITEKTFFVQLVRGVPNASANSFTNNGDGTITDTSTGLMWASADNGSGLLWPAALAWVQERNAAGYLGHSDWRMPNAKELQSLVNYANAPDYNGKPAIDTAFFSCTVITNEGGKADFPYYWTSTTHAGYSSFNTSGGAAAYIPFGRALGWPSGQTNWVDVHGAGCQRSDPKVAPPYGYATVMTVTNSGVVYTGYSFGPQGDAIRGLNFVRLVRAGNDSGVDHIGDGIPDGWRRQYFGGSGTTTNAVSSALGDPDSDGFTNGQEYLADLNPTNAASRLAIVSVGTFGEAVHLSWIGGSAAWQYLQCSPSLAPAHWTTFYTNMPPTDISNAVIHTSAGTRTRFFYRILAERCP